MFSDQSMQAITITDGQLVHATLPCPTLAAGEVLLKVAYAGVNRADLLQRQGLYAAPEGASPLPGLEVSGHIAKLADDVVGWGIGEPVCALLNGGGYAEYVAVPATQLLPVPARLSLQQAAALPEGLVTAYMALGLEAALRAGERVLVHGGSSGTGHLIAQTARAFGGEVYATAGSPEKCAMLTQLAITPINHRDAPFAEQLMAHTGQEGVDIIVDILGGPQLSTHLKLLRKGGRLVSLAVMEGAVAESVKMSSILMKHLRLIGTTLRARSAAEKAEMVGQVRRHIWPLISTGTITPVIDQVFPLASAEKAHQRMEERLHLGKILLEVAANK